MRCLVTGGSGFIGSVLVRCLLDLGHEVLITGRQNEQKVSAPCLSYTFHDLHWKSISPIDIVFHQAAITDTTHKPEKDFYFVNVHCAKDFFEKALLHGCKKFIYASSCAVYGTSHQPFHEKETNPSNAYGASKLQFDQWAIPWGEENKVSVIGLRYSNVFGNGEEHKGKSASMIYQLMQQMKVGRPRLFKWGEQQRDFVHIDDVVDANLLASETKATGVFNVGSGRATSFNQIVAILNKVLGTNWEVEYFDNPYEGYQEFTQCDLEKSNKILGYSPKGDIETYLMAKPNSIALLTA